MTKGFPNDFLWGPSSSAAQVEGGFNVDGKGLTTWDYEKNILTQVHVLLNMHQIFTIITKKILL